MNILTFINHLNEKYGWNINSSYYTQIQDWKYWWQGYYQSFHKITESNLSGTQTARDMYRLKMPKQVCEDWATLLLNDKTTITVEDEASAAFLTGGAAAQQTGGLLGGMDFWVNANGLVEQAFRSGTGAFVMSAEDIRIDGESVQRSENAQLHLDYLPAECILPLTVKHGRVIDVAFASEVVQGGRSCVYLQSHILTDRGYVIRNQYFRSENEDSENATYEEFPVPNGIAAQMVTGSDTPWFAIFSPAGLKNISFGNGLGMAIFHEAIDAAKMVDLAFDNYCRDLYLGGKKVFYNRNLIQTVFKDGGVVQLAPDNIRQQLFVQVADNDPDGKPDWHEYNPDLRTDQNSQAVQDALDYLSFKVGLGTHHYQFNSGNIATATQYAGDRQDMVQHAQRHHTRIEAALISIVRALLWGGKNLIGLDVDPNTVISINWDDSYISDAGSRRAQDQSDAMNGFIPKYRYNMEWRGMSEEEAKQAVQEAQEETGSTGDMDLFGGA